MPNQQDRPMWRLALGVVLLALSVAPAGAEQRFEIFGSGTTAVTAPAGQFGVDYVPRLVFGTVTGGRARHDLDLAGERTVGFDAGVNWLPVAHAGLQMFVARTHQTVTGSSAPYSLELTYLARQPPDFVERELSLEQEVPWTASRGELTAWRIGIDGLLRFAGHRADLSLTGGLLLTRLSGTFEPVGYYEYRLGGHSTIFFNEALVSMRIADGWHAGYNAGAELGIRAGRRAHVLAGVRVFGPAPQPSADVAEVLNQNQMLFSIPRSEIDAAVGGRPVTFDRLDRVVLRFGLRVGF